MIIDNINDEKMPLKCYERAKRDVKRTKKLIKKDAMACYDKAEIEHISRTKEASIFIIVSSVFNNLLLYIN